MEATTEASLATEAATEASSAQETRSVASAKTEMTTQGITAVEIASSTTTSTTLRDCPNLNLTNVLVGVDVICFTINYAAQTSFNISYGTPNSQAMMLSYIVDTTVLLTDLSSMGQYMITVAPNDCPQTVNTTLTTVGQCIKLCMNGNCFVNNSNPGEYFCKCFDGFVLADGSDQNCIESSVCSNSDCGPNAECTNSDGCVCLPGYRKNPINCELNDLCIDTPCQNGANCSTDGLTVTCACPPNYHGGLCASFQSPCSSNPCENNGICHFNSSSSLPLDCVCPSTYTGSTCTMDVDECLQANSCDENANCSNFVSGFSCTCNEGFRSNERGGCLKIILFPFGEDEGDTQLVIGDDEQSDALTLDYAIPFGAEDFTSIRLTSNGIIALGSAFYYTRSLYRPPTDGFGRLSSRVALLAPFWDDFQPSVNNAGRVYYQHYDVISGGQSNRDDAIIAQVKERIESRYNITDFNPIFVYKATWMNVTMYPDSTLFRNYPSTFQAVLTTDGCDTYVMYLYKEEAMLWQTGLRDVDEALIGYTNGADMSYVETQRNYRPDQRSQTGGGTKGQYFYKLTSGGSDVQNARCDCLRWYLNDVRSGYTPIRYDNCPRSTFQAVVDPRFAPSIENALLSAGIKSSSEIDEWRFDRQPSNQCYQRRNGTGPRCCYSLRRGRFITSRFWGFEGLVGPLTRGPRQSRTERFQIPRIDSSGNRFDKRSNFATEFQNALNGDLIPRRQCCITSRSSGYCRLYRLRRPAATSNRYFACFPSFLWGDPHITTLDSVSYTFNGLGEYIMVYAPSVITVQARTKKVAKEDGTLSDATGFVAFAVRDHTNNESGIVQFDLDYDNPNGNGVIVKVNGQIQTDIDSSDYLVESVALSLNNGSYEATFPSEQSVTVSATSFLLTIQFTGDPSKLQNVSKGLLGFWSGVKEDDFELRNGTTLDYNELKVTTDLDILNGTLSEMKLYEFGQTWKISEKESLFNYTGGNDTFPIHNPVNSPNPPFLEVLVAEQRTSSLFEEIRANCTMSETLSTQCLYDTLTTNRTEIGQTTLEDAASSVETSAINANTPPNATIPEMGNFVNGFLQAQINVTSMFRIEATDIDGDDITYGLADENELPNVLVDSTSGMATWTPTTVDLSRENISLVVQAADPIGETVIAIPIKLCPCQNNGTCLYDTILSGSDTYQITQCNCTEAYSGDDCSEDRNGCELSACYTNVTCTDNPAPQVGEMCGPCPNGTTGDGRNCTAINFCQSNPCSQICNPIFNGFNCSCFDGYRVNSANSSLCDDINECTETMPCQSIPSSTCNNNIGNFSCDCDSGYVKVGSVCNNIDECNLGTDGCDNITTTCFDQLGTFQCMCRAGYRRQMNDSFMQSPCVDIDECADRTHNCLSGQSCVNMDSTFRCECATGFQNTSGTCEDINECSNSSLNNCNTTVSFCINIDGGYNCSCQAGFSGNGRDCVDVNECQVTNTCDSNAACDNTFGGFDCTCNPGFREGSGTCDNIDECQDNTDNCHANATCTDTEGSFQCVCVEGFTGNGTECEDVNECAAGNLCVTGADCINIPGSFSCVCNSSYYGNGSVCRLKPVLGPVSAISTSTTCIAILVDNSFSYSNYTVRWESFGVMRRSVDTSLPSIQICGLSPNTNYNISAGVTLETNSDEEIVDPIFSTPVTVLTEQVKLQLNLVLLGVNFSAELLDINSLRSQMLINNTFQALIDEFNLGPLSFNLVTVAFLAFRNGSVRASTEAVVDSNNASVASTNVSGAFSGSMRFSDPMTMSSLSQPGPIMITAFGSENVTFNFSSGSLMGVTEYQVEVSCDGSTDIMSTNETELVVTQLSSNTICSARARALVEVGTAVAYSPYTDSVTFTTLHVVSILSVSASGTSAQVTFVNVMNRVTMYTITTNPATTTDEFTASDVNGSNITRTLDGLRTGTEYMITVSITTQDHVADSRTISNSMNVTTSNASTVNGVRIRGVTATAFTVTFDNVVDATVTGYVVRVHLGDNYTDYQSSISTVPISGVSPLNNVYLVSVAFETPTRSDFSSNVSTMIWNFNETLETSFFIFWDEYPSTTFYDYSVYVDVDDLFANTEVAVSFANVTGLESGTVHNILVKAREIVGPMITMIELFNVSQITRPSAPMLTAQPPTPDNLTVSWSVRKGADSYNATLFDDNRIEVIGVGGVGSTTATNLTLTDLEDGTNYYLQVCSVNSAGSTCGEITVTGFIPVPSPPMVIEVTQTTVALNFTAISTATSYNVTAVLENGTLVEELNVSITNVTFQNLLSGTVYIFSLEVTYPGGSSDPSFGVSQITVPPDVTNITVAARTRNSLNITFSPSMSATSYKITVDGTSYNMTVSYTAAFIDNLTDGTPYNVSVVAINSAGESPPVTEFGQYTRSISPARVIFGAITADSLVVSWDLQRPNLNTTSYQPTVVCASNGTSAVTVNATTDTQTTIMGLEPGTEYNVTITTVDAFGLVEAASSPGKELTLPGAPARLFFTEHTDKSLTFAWELVQSAQSYRVVLNETTSSAFPFILDNPSVTETLYTVPSLQSGAEYLISVSAMNRNGQGEPTTLTDYTITNPFPSVAGFVSNTNSSIEVNVTSVNGPVNYTVRAMLADNPSSTEMFTCVALATNVCTISSLAAGTNYSVRVKGTYSSGSESQFGDEMIFTTVSNPPENLSFTSGDFGLNISTNPAVGATSYTFTIGILNESTESSSPTASFTGLASGTIYVITATATLSTSYGNFTSSEASFTTTTTQAIPVNVLISNVQPNQFNVSWDVIHGAVGYLVNVDPLDTLTRVVTEASSTSLTVFGRTPGIVHNITVQGTYPIGNGSESEVVQQITAPAQPTGLMVQTVTADEVTLVWNQVSTATSYRLLYAEETSRTYLNITLDVTNVTISGLQNATTYNFRVVALNGILESDQSSEVRQITAPLAPTFRTNSTTQTTIIVVWNIPAGAATFVVEVTNEIMTPFYERTIISNSIELTFTDGIRPGTNYTICVAAQTSSLNSSKVASSVKSCIFLVTAPADPSAPLEIESTSNSLYVRWNAAEGAVDYKLVAVERDNSTAVVFTEKVGNVTKFNITGLSPETIYVVSVISFNELGAASNASSSDLQTRPIRPTVSLLEVTNSSILITWTLPAGVLYSQLQVQRADGSALETGIQETSVIDEPTNSSLVSGLTSGTEYIFSITLLSTKRSEEGTLTYTTLPAAPENLGINAQTTSSLDFIWDSVTGASSYFITLYNSGFTQTISNNSPTASFTDLPAGTAFTGTVVANNYAGNGSAASYFTATVIEGGFTINQTAVGETSVTLSYIAPPAAFSYAIYFSSGNETQSMNTTMISPTITNLTSGVQYTFTVTAIYETARSNASEQLSLYTRTLPPTGIEYNATGADGISLRFTQSLGAVSYRVMGIGPSGEMLIAENVTSTTISFANATLGVSYNFSIVSINGDGLTSAAAYVNNVEAPLLVFEVEVILQSSIVFVPAFGDITSQEYMNLINGLIAELRIILSFLPGFQSVNIIGVFQGSVTVQFTVITNQAGSTAQNVIDTFQSNIPSNSTYFNDTGPPPSTELNRCFNNPCPINSTCSSSMSEFTCTCNSGLELNSTDNTCDDVNECNVNTYCDPNADCTNSFGSFSCVCRMGFTGNGTTCSDNDECLPTSPCNTNAQCTNNVGSFDCFCNEGYSGDGFSVCTDIKECENSSLNNCHENAGCTEQIPGFNCTCNNGFTGNGTYCNNTNECLSSPCHNDATCNDTAGSFTCECNLGFQGNGTSCEDINECADSSSCHTNANCENMPGSFTCDCNSGYTGNGTFCADVNECETNTDNCHAEATCTNSIGNFSCACNSGFVGNGTTCDDVDECLSTSLNECSINAECSNTIGNYTCDCSTGYTGDGRTCNDVDECSTSDPCDSNAVCNNTDGSFVCVCNPGYSLNSSLLTCTDVNECDNTATCHPNATCTNTEGSFMCACNAGTTGDGAVCFEFFVSQITLLPSFIFTEDLTNSSSPLFIELAQNVTSQIDRKFGANRTQSTVIRFVEGSVIAIILVEIREPFTSEQLIALFDDSLGDPIFANGPSTTLTCGACAINAVCNETDSDMCSCSPGYSGNGVLTCDDIDECQDTSNCGDGGQCINSVGSYTCQCDSGYNLVSGSCVSLCSEFCQNSGSCNVGLDGNPLCT
ncbi:unnamed protein product [Clavelina lepadiformis]